MIKKILIWGIIGVFFLILIAMKIFRIIRLGVTRHFIVDGKSILFSTV